VPKTTRYNIAVCQVHLEHPGVLYEPEIEQGIARYKHDSYDLILKSLKNGLSLCAKKASIAILPENSVPLALVSDLRDEAARLELTILFGLEHEIEWRPSTAKEGDYQAGAFSGKNQLAVVWPSRDKQPAYFRKNVPAIMKDHSIVEQIERARTLEFLLVDAPIAEGGNVRLWPVLCSDFLMLESGDMMPREELLREVCEQDIDVIAVLSHTQRIDPFHGAMERLLVGSPAIPTSIAFANLACYGGSVCLGYSERIRWRKAASQKGSWRTKALRKGEEECSVFPNWKTSMEAARRARHR
jgi:hypothetical protein